MASSSKHLSDFLSRIGPKPGQQGNGEVEEEPDWLLQSDEDVRVVPRCGDHASLSVASL
jgi:hypothetical protein